jgi:hypothetical protein
MTEGCLEILRQALRMTALNVEILTRLSGRQVELRMTGAVGIIYLLHKMMLMLNYY